MKKNLLIGIVLFAICSIVAILMVTVNSVTKNTIKENEEKKTQDMLQVLFRDMKSASDMEEVNDNSYVVGVYTIYSDTEKTNVMGYVYKGTGANGYGAITMLVGIDNNLKITGVQYLENGQTKDGSTIETVGYDYVMNGDTADSNYVADIKAGVTYGSDLVNSIMSSIKAYAVKGA